ncbi:Cytochrome c oxidase assembly factor [Trichinella spiralis]|uniref:Cytochrome c oxidase assembly factor 5 n=1 Tax=Trichinella spiralis TaxID=6334 RepID=A0ABR3KN68_TRISP
MIETPEYTEDSVVPNKKSRACDAIRFDLKYCLLQSDCVRKENKTPRECLKSGNVPDDCKELSRLLFECKRTMFDRRWQFKGRIDY